MKYFIIIFIAIAIEIVFYLSYDKVIKEYTYIIKVQNGKEIVITTKVNLYNAISSNGCLQFKDMMICGTYTISKEE